jgi:hypothetical protein
MRALLALFSILLRLGGLTVIIIGLWFSAGALRLVVSGRIDERNEAEKSLKVGLPLFFVGVVLLLFGFWLENHFFK